MGLIVEEDYRRWGVVFKKVNKVGGGAEIIIRKVVVVGRGMKDIVGIFVGG